MEKLTRQLQAGGAVISAPTSSKPVRASRRRGSGECYTSSTAGNAVTEGGDALPDERIQSANSYRATTTDSLIDTLRNNLHRRAEEGGLYAPPETEDFNRLLAPPAPVPMLSPFKLEGAQQSSFRDDSTHRSGGIKSPRYLRVSKKTSQNSKISAGPRPSPYRKRVGIDDSSEENIGGVDTGDYVPTAGAPNRIVGVQAASVKLQAPPSISPRGT